MATDAGQTARSIAERLFAEPHVFEFAQAVRLLERLRPGAVPLGTGLDPRAEALSLSGALAPVFAPSALGALRRASPRSLAANVDAHADEWQPPELEVNLLSLGGPEGPLPDAYQEWLQDRARRRDTSAASFLNLFQHRLLALLYRSQRKYRLADPFLAPQHSPVQTVLRGMTGMLARTPRTERRVTGIDASAVLSRAGLMANRRRSLAGFDVIASQHFGVPARSSPFAGGWRILPEASRTRVGREGRNHLLGQGAVAGTRIWDEHRGICIDIGPLSLETYQSFLPGGPCHVALHGLAAVYFGADLYCDVDLTLAAGQQPGARLSAEAPLSLGWTTWLGARHAPPVTRTTRVRLQGNIETAETAG
jgi:type VI secretion system protein ImpH